MKGLKKEISSFLAAALVVSTVALGFGQIKSQALQAAGQTIQYRIYCETGENSCNGAGTDSNFKLKIVFDDGQIWYSGVIDDTGDDNDMEADDNNNMYVWGPAKPITSTGLYQDNSSGGIWDYDIIQFFADFGTGAWVQIASTGSGSYDTVGGTINVPYNGVMDTTYNRTLTFSGNGGTANGGSAYVFNAIQGATYPASNTPTNVLRTDFIFTGWSPAAPATVCPQVNTTYYAQWTPNRVNITFDANGGIDGTGPTAMEIGSALTPPTVLRTGYTFLDWLPAVPATVPIADTTYTAQWMENPTITFDTKGGSAVDAITSAYNAPVSKPENPVKDGYNFGEWYLEPECITQVVWPFTATQNTTFFARWNAVNNYTITFNVNGGTGSTSAALPAGEPLTAPVIARTGYTLAGWSPMLPDAVPMENTIYTAQWTANNYSIGYDGNGNDAGSTATSLHTYDIASTLTANGFTKTGNSLSGWSTDPSATVATYTNGQSVLNLTPNQGEVIPLYAVWSINSYTITFSANGGSGGTSASKQYGSALTAPTVTRTGYTFANWSPEVPATVPAGNTTYTAQWTANQYLVTFDPQGGTVSPETSTVTYSSTYGAGTGGFPTPTRTGYTFGGWYTGTGGSGTNKLSTTTVSTAAAHTLYAKWTANTYTIAYNGNGSTGGSTANSTHTYGTEKTLAANSYTKTGFAFIGWTTSPDGAVVYTDSQSALNLTETCGATVTLYAKWTDVNVTTITFDANGGTGGKSTTLLIGAALAAPTVTRTGFALTGWSPVVPANVPLQNTTYTAQWTVVTTDFSYTVSNTQATITKYNGSGSNVTIPASLGGYPVTEIGQHAFDAKVLITHLVIPDSVVSIGDDAFINCTGLTSVELGSGLKSIGDGAFLFCDALSSITIPDSVTSIGSHAFNYCDGLTSVVLGNGLTSIGAGAFASCENLTSINIPSSVTTFGASVFEYDSKLAAAYFYGNAPTTVGSFVFFHCADGFTVYHLSDKTGFTSPTWYTYPTAVFTPVSTITFDANGGTGGTSSSMTYGATLTAPVVSKAGYVLTGWSPLVSSTVPAVDTTYTAQWDIDLTEAVQFSVSSSEGISGDLITVSIDISENSNIGAAKFELPFDPGLLEYVSASAGTAITSGLADINFDAVNNKIIMTYINSNGLTAAGSILDVQFRIKNSASPQTTNTNFTVVELTDSDAAPLQSIITQGTISVTRMLGDINGNGAVTAVDALMALQAASGKIILTGAQILGADVNKDGAVTAIDALKILQFASGKITSF